MKNIKGNFIKNEEIQEVYLDYIDKDEEGKNDVFYKKAKTRVITYMEKALNDEMLRIDDDIYYECELKGIVRVYYKNGDIHQKEITDCAIYEGDESYNYNNGIDDIEKGICSELIYKNSKISENKDVICNLEKIEIYWNEGRIEISTYDCEYCGEQITLRSRDNGVYCHGCGCNFCKDCLTEEVEYEGVVYDYLCPHCMEDLQEESYI